MAPGGYRKPAHPAPVSGPAQLSQRTDGGPGQAVRELPNAKYGQNADYVAQEQGAPLAKTDGLPPAAPVQTPATPPSPPPDQAPLPPISGFAGPSERPNEPVTAGSPLGPGPGPVNNMPTPQPGQLSAALAPYFAADDTGYVRLLAEDLAKWGL